MSSSSVESGGLSSIGRQARDVLTETTEWPELARELDVSRYCRDDTHAEWHAKTPFEPMFLAYLYARVEDIPTSTLPRRMEEQPELAEAFGFDSDDLPSESTCKPSRMKNRFVQLETETNVAVREIRLLAAQCGAPIGVKLPESDDDPLENPSERTIDRLIRSTSKRVIDEAQKTAFPAIDLPRPDDPIYDDEELLTLESVAALNRETANGGAKSLGDELNPDPDPDDPFYKDGPTGETLIESIKEMSVDEIADRTNNALERTYTRARPYLDELEKANNVLLSIDITYVAYWGDRDEMRWVQGAPDDKEYDWCHKFATAVIVGDNVHFTVGVQPLGSVDYADNEAYPGDTDQSYHTGDVVRRLLSRLPRSIDVHTVYADRGFYAADAIHALEEADLFYVIPAPKRKRLKRTCDNFDSIKNGFGDDDRDVQMYVQEDYPIHGQVKDQVQNTRVRTNLVLLPPDDDEDEDDEPVSGPQPFVTNLAVSDELRIDRRETARKINQYNNRAAIENTYSSIKQCAAWTASKAFEVRWFHFAFGCVIYNLWLLIDLLTQERIGVIETRTKPRITLKRFFKMLKRELIPDR